jgi:transitional endoplasmic reticulum ATPase
MTPQDLLNKRHMSSVISALKKSEKEMASKLIESVLDENIKTIRKMVELNGIESHLLCFAIKLHLDPFFVYFSEYIGSCNFQQFITVIGLMLDYPENQLLEALSPTGVLANSGLLTVDYDKHRTFSMHLDLFSNEFANLMSRPKVTADQILEGIINENSEPLLTLNNFHHIEGAADRAVDYLKAAIAHKKVGVNILVYGSPGTGKTQFANVLAKNIECQAYDVSNCTRHGFALDGMKRLKALSVAQYFLSPQRTVIIFDEVEDIFNDGGDAEKSTAQKHKAWMNKLLETNPIPCIWITNTLRNVDPAFIRRFDLVMPLTIPGLKVREEMYTNVCHDVAMIATCKNLAQSPHLAPAVVARAAAVVRDLKTVDSACSADDHLVSIINSTLVAQGHSPISISENNSSCDYDPDYVNADVDLRNLVEGLNDYQEARICLSGPPGTGKTAFVSWLSAALDKKVIHKRASDLLSKWVGENEQNLAASFTQAKDEGAILFIDEVDSFLYDRNTASQSWQVSQVNELLTQMESFKGLFIAATNRLEHFDSAAMRRFDLKVAFDYLLPTQVWKLFVDSCQALEIPMADHSMHERLIAISVLAPGDFAAIKRRHRFKPITTAEEFLDQLVAEVAYKAPKQSRIGF